MPTRHPRVPTSSSSVPAQPSAASAEAPAATQPSVGRLPGSGGASGAASFSVRGGSGSFATAGMQTAAQAAAQAAEAAAAQAQHAAAASVTRAMLFPWERRQFDGRGGKLRTWEKLYWGVFVTAVAGLLFSKVLLPAEKEQEIDQEKETRKKELARLLLAGGLSLTDADADVFEGLSPSEISAYVAETTEGVSSSDPFEGMSPEEINEYLEANKPRGAVLQVT